MKRALKNSIKHNILMRKRWNRGSCKRFIVCFFIMYKRSSHTWTTFISNNLIINMKFIFYPKKCVGFFWTEMDNFVEGKWV